MTFMIIYVVVINTIGYFSMGYDKMQARKSGHRVPEKQLFGIAVLGGALGSWLGMRKYRHKTKHMSFLVGIPALFILNVAYIIFAVGHIAR
jgi:uncharacterized membrane protein YsdA (DUF1294 family)